VEEFACTYGKETPAPMMTGVSAYSTLSTIDMAVDCEYVSFEAGNVGSTGALQTRGFNVYNKALCMPKDIGAKLSLSAIPAACGSVHIQYIRYTTICNCSQSSLPASNAK
jgi:hypothetical protein